MNDLTAYFNKHHLTAETILYIYRQDKKTVVCCADGRQERSVIPVHAMQAFLPEDAFVNISKGVLVRRDQIVHIGDDGIYTMSDGKTFQGRRRSLSAHKRLRNDMRLPAADSALAPPLGLCEKCGILDEMPLAYCVIELTFDENGHGVDFIFRYCNRQMAAVEGVPIPEMLGRSFYEVFKNGDRKWLVAYADVALNGTKRIIHDYSPEIGQHLTIYCYQPEPGFCACVLLPEEPLTAI